MRVAIVYDCLFPQTVGGAERWYRRLAERLAEDHEVTYLTRRQWSGDQPPDPGRVRYVAVAPGSALYAPGGRRRIWPPIRFGLGVLWHLARHRRRYDIVHLCAFPYFSLIAARLATAGGGPGLVVDWFEVWTAGYWRDYLGPVAGWIGKRVQRLCVRLTPGAFVFSRLHLKRLSDEGIRRPPVLLPGLYWGEAGEPSVAEAKGEMNRTVLFAGRMIPEKQVTRIPAAIRIARERDGRLGGVLLGDGPDRDALLERIAQEGVEEHVEAPGFVETQRVAEEMRSAMCLLLPSRREGYGAVVVEAASVGTPSVVVAHDDNAAVELIVDGENGVVAPSGEPADLAAAILRIASDPEAWRRSTRDWFRRRSGEMSVSASLERVEAEYRRLNPAEGGHG